MMKKLMSLLFAFLTVIISVCDILIVADADISELEKINDTIERYYELSYDMWWNLEEVSFADVLDMDSVQSYNKVIALREVIFNWKYSIANGFYKGQREKNLVEIEFVESRIVDSETASVIFKLKPMTESRGAYPPFVCLGENSFVLKNKNGKWLIANHDYDGYLFEKSLTEKQSVDYQAIIDNYLGVDELTIANELSEDNSVFTPYAYPYTDYSYNAQRAVRYANRFVYNYNTHFAPIEGRDCTNFVSQCVSYGFGSSTDYETESSYRTVYTGSYYSGWYAPNGAWVSVNSNWDYMFSSKLNLAGPRVQEVTVATMQNGDILQIDFQGDGSYDHSAILVDAENQLFAQHSPDTYATYNDYVGVKRLYRPKFFREY